MATIRAAVFLFLPLLTESAKILVLTPPIYSHCLEVSAVGGELAAKGHEVRIFLGSSFEHKNCFKKGSEGKNQIKPIIYKSKTGLPSMTELQSNITKLMDNDELNLIHHLDKLSEFVNFMCQHLLCDKEAVMALKKEKFDLAIVDCFFLSYCIYAIPHTLNIPFVSISSGMDDLIVGRPTLSSIVPSLLTKYTDKMSFWERLANSASYIMFHMMSRFSTSTDQISEYIPDVTVQSLFHIISKSELFIYNEDTVLGYPAPTMPNHIVAGGIATQPSKPLRGEFKQIYSQTTSDIVLVTFGSNFGMLPEKVEKKLAGVFRRLNAMVLWKYPNAGRDKNVIRVSWLPQNDVMGENKTKLFISHCGNNGVFEALYHGVPILCTPLFGDQFFNAVRVQHWNVGRYINLITSTEEQLYEAMSDVLNNPLYRNNMKKASAIFHSRPLTPRQRAAFWIEHVLKFGGDHLRSRGTDMSVISFLGYDLILFVVGIKLAILFAVFKSATVCYRLCCKCRKQKVKRS